MLAFYGELLGMEVREATKTRAVLALPRSGGELELHHDPHAPLRPRPSVGLYHFALLLPSRLALAAVFRRLRDVRYPFEGFADHAVSEALYLRDPEGNGLELYRDRPRREWRYRDGQLVLTTEALDIDALLATASAPAPLAPGTTLGHIHLHTADLERASAFYREVLGLKLVTDRYPGALFLAAGDYHHHLGLNLWAKGRRAPAGATGLVCYAWLLEPAALARVRAGLERRAVAFVRREGRLELTDPDGIVVELRQQDELNQQDSLG
jgi:catechol 2,3-dioxygenase